jgi:hypothetical protein
MWCGAETSPKVLWAMAPMTPSERLAGIAAERARPRAADFVIMLKFRDVFPRQRRLDLDDHAPWKGLIDDHVGPAPRLEGHGDRALRSPVRTPEGPTPPLSEERQVELRPR